MTRARNLAGDGRFVERWRHGLWSHFERPGADIRQVVTSRGTARLRNLDALGADVDLVDVPQGERVVIRANFYPAWRAAVDGAPVELFSHEGQLAFHAPRNGTYTVALEYPRYRALSVVALLALAAGVVVLARWPQSPRVREPSGASV